MAKSNKNTETPEEILEEFGKEESFSLIDFVKHKTRFPTREVGVCLDYEAAFTAQELANRIADLENAIEYDQKESTSIVGADNSAEEAELAELREKIVPVIEDYNAAQITFTLRGVAPKLWRVIDTKHRQKHAAEIKDVAKGSPEVTEANIRMNQAVNLDLLAESIISIETPDGKKADYAGKKVPVADLKYFFENVTEAEWSKLVNMAENLTFSNFAFEQEAAEPNFSPAS